MISLLGLGSRISSNPTHDEVGEGIGKRSGRMPGGRFGCGPIPKGVRGDERLEDTPRGSLDTVERIM